MEPKCEIIYRDHLLNKKRNGSILTDEERLWLISNPAYNVLLGYPYLNFDIIHLLPKSKYIIQVNLEKSNYPEKIIPIVGVSCGKGEIETDYNLLKWNGKETKKKKTKMLGVPINNNSKVSAFTFDSDLGLMSICYECSYHDNTLNMLIRESSFGGCTDFAMKKTHIGNNKIKYSCKNPLSNSFDALIFSIEWQQVFD